jgi:hypothetical protein
VSLGGHETAWARELGGGAPMADGGSLAASVGGCGSLPVLRHISRRGKERALEVTTLA